MSRNRLKPATKRSLSLLMRRNIVKPMTKNENRPARDIVSRTIEMIWIIIPISKYLFHFLDSVRNSPKAIEKTRFIIKTVSSGVAKASPRLITREPI